MPAGMPGCGGRGPVLVGNALLVNASTKFQPIDGFGGSGAFETPPGWSGSNADHFFTTLGLNMYRSELSTQFTPSIQGFSLATLSSGPNGAGDFSPELEAWNRGCRNFLLSVWVNAVDTTGGPWPWNIGSKNGVLDSAHYTDACTAITTWMDNAVAAGLTGCQFFISPANEPDITPSYAQTAWSTSQLVAFVKNNLGPALVAWATANPTKKAPKLVVCETSEWPAFNTWVAAFEADPTALSFVSYYATHQYASGAVNSPPGTISRPIWQTECSGQDGFDATMTNGMVVAGWIHNALITGNTQAWFWWVFESDNDSTNGGLIGSTGPTAILTKRSYVLGHWSKFVTAGSTRVGTLSAPSGVNVTAFQRPDGKLVLVCVNTNITSVVTPVYVEGFTPKTVVPYITDANNNLAQQSSVPAYGGVFTASLNATSVTTFLSDA